MRIASVQPCSCSVPLERHLPGSPQCRRSARHRDPVWRRPAGHAPACHGFRHPRGPALGRGRRHGSGDQVADRDLLEACHAAIRGRSFTRSGERADPQLAEPRPVRSGDPGADTDSPRGGGPQTPREGHSSKEIADTLFISIKTVERHRANMLQKLGLRDRLELARYAMRAGTYSPRVRVGIVGMVRTWRREVSRLRDPWRRGGFDDRHGSGGTT